MPLQPRPAADQSLARSTFPPRIPVPVSASSRPLRTWWLAPPGPPQQLQVVPATAIFRLRALTSPPAAHAPAPGQSPPASSTAPSPGGTLRAACVDPASRARSHVGGVALRPIRPSRRHPRHPLSSLGPRPASRRAGRAAFLPPPPCAGCGVRLGFSSRGTQSLGRCGGKSGGRWRTRGEGLEAGDDALAWHGPQPPPQPPHQRPSRPHHPPRQHPSQRPPPSRGGLAGPRPPSTAWSRQGRRSSVPPSPSAWWIARIPANPQAPGGSVAAAAPARH
mmetsp:Transcript_22017/g.42036  ORF Transcript_22017/g.42036 Transcript_22017/m.42036 type:complete len:277 (+) Transcript_22017:963-1793(+)